MIIVYTALVLLTVIGALYAIFNTLNIGLFLSFFAMGTITILFSIEYQKYPNPKRWVTITCFVIGLVFIAIAIISLVVLKGVIMI